MRKPPTFPPMTCGECGEECVRAHSMQIFCKPCSSKRDVARKSAWAKEHPSTRKVIYDPTERIERGFERSRENRSGIAWMWDNEPDLAHWIRFRVPYNKGYSKNAMWSMGAKQGHVYIRQEIKSLREAITWQVRSHGGQWFDGKVWIDLFVEKPNASSDAINVIDTICDAIKDGIGVDDRWFSIRRLDWSIVKDDPGIWIGVGQEVTEHHRACSHCGTVLPLTPENFSRNRSGPLGFGRACKGCTRKPKP